MAEHEWQSIVEANRVSWNVATVQHNRHKGDQAAFLRAGGSTLFPEEVELLGDVHVRSLVHLQCNAGQDTLSIAGRLGATATGVDISDEAIDFARLLSQDSGIPATFIRSDLYDWFDSNRRQYDIAFVTYGALVWLADISAWGRGVAAALKPGGRLVLVEFHPMLGLLFGALSGDWTEAEDYMGGSHKTWDDGVGDYVAGAAGALKPMATPAEPGPQYVNPNPCHEFAWGLADIISSLLDAGLRLETFREYPYSNGFKPFADMIELPGRRMALPEHMPVVPLMYALRAVK